MGTLEYPLEFLKNKMIYTLTSIARPDRLYALIQSYEGTLLGGYEGRDHRFFPLRSLQQDLDLLLEEHTHLIIVCTFKDRIKLPRFWIKKYPIYSLNVKVSPLFPLKELDSLLPYSLLKS